MYKVHMHTLGELFPKESGIQLLLLTSTESGLVLGRRHRPVYRGDMHALNVSNCSQGVVFSRHSLEHSLNFQQVSLYV